MNAVGFVHAAKVCSQLEIAMLAAAERAKRALVEASGELQRMLDILNEGRAARGLPPLDAQLTAYNLSAPKAELYPLAEAIHNAPGPRER